MAVVFSFLAGTRVHDLRDMTFLERLRGRPRERDQVGVECPRAESLFNSDNKPWRATRLTLNVPEQNPSSTLVTNPGMAAAKELPQIHTLRCGSGGGGVGCLRLAVPGARCAPTCNVHFV